MSNVYDEKNKWLKDYFELYINQMGIDETFRPLLIDVMMRRALEFDLTPEEIQQDVTSLVNNLKAVKIGEMPKGSESAAGVYSYATKEITISKEYIENAKTKEDFENIYEIFTHEVFHALARDEYGDSKISTLNSYTKDRFFSLEEAIVEKAADRCVYSRKGNEENSPFFHQNKFGYADITYITDIIEATYGVTEKAFLRHAIHGRKNVAEFLSNISGERIENTISFLDGIEINYSRLHNALYNSELTGEALEKEVREAMASSLLLCSWKMNSNISRINTYPDMLNAAALDFERYKYGHDKMLLVIESATDYFDRRFGNKNTSQYVLDTIKEARDDNSYRINASCQILEKRDEIPPNDVNTMLIMSKDGCRGRKGDELFRKYNISQDSLRYIPLKENSVISTYRTIDFENTQWNNSQIEYISKNVKYQYEIEQQQSLRNRLKNGVKTGIENIKQALVDAKNFFLSPFNKRQQLLPPGKVNDRQQETSNEFGALSPEDLEKFNKGVKQVLSTQNAKNDKTQESERDDFNY